MATKAISVDQILEVDNISDLLEYPAKAGVGWNAWKVKAGVRVA
jgi:hypothetical protein